MSEIPLLAKHLNRRLARVSPLVRIVVCCGAAIGLRILVVVANALPIGGAGKGLIEPRIASVAVIAVAAGVLAGLVLAKSRGERRDLLTAGLAGGLLGLLASAPWFSVLQTAERLLGSWSSSLSALFLLWSVVGVALALVSTILVPHRPSDRQAVP